MRGFAGYTSGISAVTWVGFDNLEFALGRSTLNANLGRQRQPIVGSEAGGTTALPGWILFMETALQHVESNPFELPSNMVSVRIDQPTGRLTNRTDHTSMFGVFLSAVQNRRNLLNKMAVVAKSLKTKKGYSASSSGFSCLLLRAQF